MLPTIRGGMRGQLWWMSSLGLFALASNCATLEVPPQVPLSNEPQVAPGAPDSWRIGWYQWQSPTALLISYRVGEENLSRMAQVDLVTGSAKDIVLPRGVAVDGLDRYNDRAWRTSPDGSMLLGVDKEGMRTIMVGRDLGHVVATTELASAYYAARWTPDGRGWVEWGSDGSGMVLRMTTLQGDQRTAVADTEEHKVAFVGGVYGVIAAREVLLVRNESSGTMATTLAIRGQPKIVRKWPLRIPYLFRILDADISADGKRICWLVACARPVKGDDLPVRNRAYSEPVRKLTAELWVMNVDGKYQRRVANIDVHATGQVRLTRLRVALPHLIQWMPGTEKVGYIWQSRLWLVDASRDATR